MARPLVLIVDDDPLLHIIVQNKLEDAGFKVVTAIDGEAALLVLDKVRPDMIVLDVIMYSINGFELLRRLKADPTRSSIPVVMLTGGGGEEDVVEAFRLGAADFIEKPFIPDELVARISRLTPHGLHA